MLTFATYYLLKNPSALRALREELDSVVGVGGDVQLEHLGRLPYLVGVSPLRRKCTFDGVSHIHKQP